MIYNIHCLMGPRPLSTTAVFNYNSFLLISFFFLNWRKVTMVLSLMFFCFSESKEMMKEKCVLVESSPLVTPLLCYPENLSGTAF